jgi:hypothetical protein
MGVGLGVITGTGLRLLAPHLAEGPLKLPGRDASAGLTPGNSAPAGLKAGRFEARSELTGLSQQWQQLAAAQKDLQATAFLLVLSLPVLAGLEAEVLAGLVPQAAMRRATGAEAVAVAPQRSEIMVVPAAGVVQEVLPVRLI